MHVNYFKILTTFRFTEKNDTFQTQFIKNNLISNFLESRFDLSKNIKYLDFYEFISKNYNLTKKKIKNMQAKFYWLDSEISIYLFIYIDLNQEILLDKYTDCFNWNLLNENHLYINC
jgi:hypothetical protein